MIKHLKPLRGNFLPGLVATLLLLLSYYSDAQPRPFLTDVQNRRIRGGVFEKSLHIPKGATPTLNDNGITEASGIFYRTTDSTLYTWTGTQWIKAKGAAGETILKTETELRALTDPVAADKYLLNDGKKPGLFQYDPADVSSADDDVFVFVSSNGKRIKRIFEGRVDARLFEIDADGTSQTTKINTAIANATVKEIDFTGPGASYAFNGKIDFGGKKIRMLNGAKLVSDGSTNDTIANALVDADIYAKIFDTSITVRNLWNQETSVVWFGAVADGGITDNHTAFSNAFRALRSSIAPNALNTSGKIVVPRAEKTYYLSKKLIIDSYTEFCGSGDRSGSRIEFQGNVGGVKIAYPDGQFAYIHDLVIMGFGTSWDNFIDTAHGLEVNAPFARIERVVVQGFAGNGVQSYGNTASPTPTNCNAFDYKDVESNFNIGSGFWTKGFDANAGSFFNCSSVNNGHWGYYGDDFLGLNYMNCHSASNGQFNTAVAVSHNGEYWHAKQGSTNVEPGVGDYTYYWYLHGSSPSTWPTYQPWDSTKQYYGSGSYAAVNASSRTMFFNCYAEGDQNGYYIHPPGGFIGGQMTGPDLGLSDAASIRTITLSPISSAVGWNASNISVSTTDPNGWLTRFNATNGGMKVLKMSGFVEEVEGFGLGASIGNNEYLMGLTNNLAATSLAFTGIDYTPKWGRLASIGDNKAIFRTSGFFMKNLDMATHAPQFKVANTITGLTNNSYGDVVFNGNNGTSAALRKVFAWRSYDSASAQFDSVFTNGFVPGYITAGLPARNEAEIVFDVTTGTYKGNYSGTWTDIGGGGGSSALQGVTDIGNTTTRFINADSGYYQHSLPVLTTSSGTTLKMTAVGTSALASNTGNNNTGVGYRALYANIGGTANSAVGSESLLANTTGVYNSAFGFEALKANIGGAYNVAIGGSALKANTSGDDNIALGVSALQANQTGASNLAIGTSSLLSNGTGHHNIAIGTTSLQANSSGAYNVGIGFNSLYASTGNENVAIGVSALSGTTAATNVGIGPYAGYTNTSGANNIFIGNTVGLPTTSSNRLSIGNLIYGTGINGTEATPSTGSASIGIVTPLARWHLPAGSATANTASLKIDPGTLLTTPEDGAIENDGTNYYGTQGATRAAFATTTYVQTAIAGSVSSGTYTPTITGVDNVEGSAGYDLNWYRIGDMVTVFGQVEINVTSASTITRFRASLHTASAFANTTVGGGVISSPHGVSGSVKPNAASGELLFEFTSGTDVDNRVFHFTASYKTTPP